MKKVILNKCFGGFVVSEEGHRLYAKKKGFELNIYERTNLQISEGYKKVEKQKSIFNVYCTKDLGNIVNEIPDEYCLYLNKDYREDPILIEVIEELGEKANTDYSELKIVEIPDDMEYVIDDYDGIETLHQKVQEW